MMRLIGVLSGVIATMALAGCAAGPALGGPATGHVTGTVIVRACGGAFGEDQAPCRVSSALEAEFVFQLGGAGVMQTATTDVNGRYGIDLKPGTYTVQVIGIRVTSVRASHAGSASPLAPASTSNGAGRVAGRRTVEVVAGRTVTADFTFTIQLL